MKVTIEPTEQHNEYPNSTVTISYPTDDISCEDVVNMVLNALVAWGYDYENVFEERETIVELDARIVELGTRIKELEELNVRLPDKKRKGVK